MEKDDIEFPPLPDFTGFASGNSHWTIEKTFHEYAKSYALISIEADRQRRHEGANASEAYDTIDSFLRNNLDDDDYSLYSKALDVVYESQQPAEPVKVPSDEELGMLFGMWRWRTKDGRELRFSHFKEMVQVLLSRYGHTDEQVKNWPDGTPRDPRDIASDPYGKLIHDPAEPLLADKKARVPSDAELDAVILSVQHNGRSSDDIRYVRDICRALLARYGHNYHPRYKDSDDFHANASLPELDAWQRGWDDCNKDIEAEGWQLVPKELIEFIEAKEHHLPIEDRHALSNMLKAAPKFGEKE